MNPTFQALAVISAGLFCISAIGYLYYVREQKLKEFRANLRPGDMVRVRLLSGQSVPARIVAKNSAINFVAREIDSKKQRLTSVDFIYRP
jgi:hypothetical protein